MCVWLGLTRRLPGSSLASLVRQHRPGSIPAAWFGFSHLLLKGMRISLILWTLATPSQLALGQESSPGMLDTLDPGKRSQEHCPTLVVTSLSSGALQ